MKDWLHIPFLGKNSSNTAKDITSMSQKNNAIVQIPPEQNDCSNRTKLTETVDQLRQTTIGVQVAIPEARPLTPTHIAHPAGSIISHSRPDNMRSRSEPLLENLASTSSRPFSAGGASRKGSHEYMSKHSWLESAFNERAPSHAKQQVEMDAVVSAEVRTNVIVRRGKPPFNILALQLTRI